MPRLLAAIDDLHAASARFLFATWRSEWETRTDHDHRAILTALRQNDVDVAATILPVMCSGLAIVRSRLLPAKHAIPLLSSADQFKNTSIVPCIPDA